MSKPRRKSEIRQHARAEVQRLTQKREVTCAADWRAVFLDALIDGMSVTNAAMVAGIKRSRVYQEQGNPAFKWAMMIARYYGDYGIKWVSRPLWPPTAKTVQQHEATFQRIEAAQRYQLVGGPF